ncbi:hypothetical protein K437DRAFT_253358 [Tilletiaria anomala UBC 951]|uniref:BHLH domain-containing protein n=1 Tax=Tilletiaria anomala (strain ATCC 24038 / CBS 436.72 / UBC 951) TaxID=1037660 RepID=A0A066WH50_TILAU|nr:uncharacterized protein K437DRAFT_253358 [Tilletiaria anomala UBC 951]KDN53322.1 hypothetical protein K437DRAFT_253358 [Tilletiaria anomala UBC 951]
MPSVATQQGHKTRKGKMLDDNDRASTSASGMLTGGSSGKGRSDTTSGNTYGAHGDAGQSMSGSTTRSSAFDLPPMPVPYEDFQFSLDLPEEVSFSDIELVRSPNFNDLFGMSTNLAALSDNSSSMGMESSGSSSGRGGSAQDPMSGYSSAAPSAPPSAPVSQAPSYVRVPASRHGGTSANSDRKGKAPQQHTEGEREYGNLAAFHLRPPPPPDFTPPPGPSLFSFDIGQDMMQDVSIEQGGRGAGSGSGSGSGSQPGPGLGTGTGTGEANDANNLFNARESNFLTSFLEGFDWDFQPLLPEGMPSFADAERGSFALGLEGCGSPTKAGSTPGGGGTATRTRLAAGRNSSGRKGARGPSAVQSPTEASDATSPRGSGTSEATAVGERRSPRDDAASPAGAPAAVDREQDGERERKDLTQNQRKRRTTEASRAAVRECSTNGDARSMLSSIILEDPAAASTAASGLMHPLMAQSQAGTYPPQHPHAAIMQAAESGNFSSAFPWLPPGSLTMPPASFDLQQATPQARTRTFDQMMSEDGQQQQQQQQQQLLERQQAQNPHPNHQMLQHHPQQKISSPAPDGSAAEPEKRQHHIFSEQRRRTNIREGFKELVELLELGRVYGARGLGLASGAGTGIEDEGLDDRSDDEEDEEGSGLPKRKKGKARNRRSGGPATRGKGKGRGRGGSAGGGAGSKSAVLFQAVDLLRWLHGRNQVIEEQCDKIEALLPGPKKSDAAMQM